MSNHRIEIREFIGDETDGQWFGALDFDTREQAEEAMVELEKLRVPIEESDFVYEHIYGYDLVGSVFIKSADHLSVMAHTQQN